MKQSNKILLYATNWCYDCRRAKMILESLNQDYEFIDIDLDEAAAGYVISVNNGFRSVPTIVFPDGKILVEPSNQDLQNAIKKQPAY